MMPSRRPSATAQNLASTSARVHRSNGSNHSMSGPPFLVPAQNLPYTSTSVPATPQQKVVYVLVNRLKNKLPCNSGVSLTDIEADDSVQQVVETLVEMSRESLDIIGWALTELLEKLAKQTDSSGYTTVDVLQSQLFTLKVLSICMASRWGGRHEAARSDSRSSKQPSMSTFLTSDSPSSTPYPHANGSGKRRPQWATDHPSLLIEPPPLDESCARYILSVMVLLLRQTAPLKHRLMSSANMDFAASYHDFESVDSPDATAGLDALEATVQSPILPPNISPFPQAQAQPILRAKKASSTSLKSATPSSTSLAHSTKHSLVYEKTSLVTSKSISSLNRAIAKFAGRIVYHLSASNWPIVLSRIRNKIRYLANAQGDDPDIIDLQLMKHSALDRARLVQSLQELSSLLLNMKPDAHSAIAIPLRAAIWNWIDLFPDEFNETLRQHRRMDGAPERVFDILFDSYDSQYRPKIWPTLAALACISSERIRNDMPSNSLGVPRGQPGRRDRNFAQLIVRSMLTQDKASEEALVCALDMARAAFRVRPEDGVELGLQLTAHDIAHEVKRLMFSWGSQKPFWDCPDEIDVALMADIIVTIFRYLPEEEILPIFSTCLEPERSHAVKISAIKACITLINEATRCPWQQSLHNLRDTVKTRMIHIFHTATIRRSEVDEANNVKKPALRPKAKRYTSETLPDHELLVFSLLALFRADPTWYLSALDDNPAIKIAMAHTFRSTVDNIARMSPDHPLLTTSRNWLQQAGPAILATVCINLLESRTDFEAQRMWIKMAYESIYRFSRKAVAEHMSQIQITSQRVPAFAIAEIACLVSLTSADTIVTLTAAHCLRLLAQAETAPGAPIATGLTEDERVKRYPIYEQLGDPKVMVVGRIGHQKRVRKLLRLMPSSSPIHVAVWQECYWRWCALSEMTIRMSIDSTADGFDSGAAPVGDKVLSTMEREAQWQNLTLFLAATGSACIRGSDEPPNLTLDLGPSLLADEMQTLRDPTELLGLFLQHNIDLLISETIQIRDTARDALGSEASPKLYTRIFKELDNVVRQLAEGDSVNWENLAIFVEQFLGIMKVLVENIQYLEEIRGMELGSTLSVIAGFIGRFHDIVSYRLRLKFCNMCESIFNQGETMSVRKDSSNRQKIADIIIEWIQDPTMCDHELSPIQRDVNQAAFRAAVKLFDRLQLQPPDGTSSDEAVHVTSRLFIRYSSILFKVWELTRSDAATADDGTDKSSLTGVRSIQRDGELRELVITGLASLVSANQEVGVKHCLPLAYDEDSSRRVIFAYVFCRILPQGIALNPQEQQPMVQRQSRLCELVKGPDMSLALAICEVCPASEVDTLISVMLNLFDTRTSLMTLLKNMIDQEVGRTDSDTSLFRGNSTCTRFLSAFANIYGYNYLRSLIIPLIKTMTSMPAGHGYDLNPAKVGEVAAEQNRVNIKLVTSSFLQIILSSVPAVPPMLREICAHIAKVVNEVWPEAKFAAVGAFMFLRFISPAIVAPETVDVEVPKDDMVIRRGLMLVAKIIQNLANNIFFGKEAHMVILNDFLSENIFNVTKFLSELNKYTPIVPEEEPEEWLETTYDDTDTIVLHRFLEKHADKVGKELLSSSKPPTEKLSHQAEVSAANGKRVWDALCGSLVELGQPMEAPRVATANSREHTEYLDLMARYQHRDTSRVQDLFVEATTSVPQETAIFALSVSRIDVEVLDVELLLFYVFKTLSSPTHENREFEIIIDLTCFSLPSQLPVQWVKFAYEVIPVDIRSRFRTAHLLMPNALAVKYLRRLYNLGSGSSLAKNYVTYSSIDELLQYLPAGTSIPSLDYAVSLEEEDCSPFTDVTMRHTHPMRVPVTLEVAQSHLRITTMKAQIIGGTLNCKATEILPLSDVNDVYNVSTGHETNEFIIRKLRQGITLYFSSPARDTIVKAIRSAKSNMRLIQLPGTERLSRFSNVIATLLHVGMIGVSSLDEDVKMASNELLQTVCMYLDLEGKPLVTSKTSLIDGLPGPFLIQLSESLASLAPQLTLDFISEVSATMTRSPVNERIMTLHYVAPWVKNLAFFTDPASKYYEPSATKFRDCIRALVDVTLTDSELHGLIQRYIWAEIAKLDSTVVNAVLDELMRAAVDGGSGSPRCERVADTMGAMSTINVRGRLLSRLRKVMGKTSTKPTKSLGDNIHWNEISCLTRLVLVACHHCKNVVQSMMYVPEVAHLVSLTAGIGATHVRISVYGIVVGLLNALYTARLGDSSASPELQQLISECEQPETLRLFGLLRPTPTSDYVNLDPPGDKLYIDTVEGLVRFLVRVLEVMSGSIGLLNVWRARWMSLVTSSAFQLSPAIQTRAFVSLGILVTSDVDDDLLYQMLVAFKTALSQSSEDDTTTVLSMLRCIRHVVPALPRNSRYLCQLFWLAVALLQASHRALYVEAIHLLRITVEVMDGHGAFQESGVSRTLLEGRAPLEEVARQLDELLGLSFESNFSFSLASIIFKGLRHPGLMDPTEAALRSLVKATVRTCDEAGHTDEGRDAPVCQDVLGYFLALLPASTTAKSFRRLLEEAGVHESWLSQEYIALLGEDDPVCMFPFSLLGLSDGTMALFVTSFVSAMLTTALADDCESQVLFNLLSDTADAFPDTVAMTYESLQDKIKDAFANSSSPIILSAVSNLFQVAVHDAERAASARGSASTLSVDDGATHGPGRSHLEALREQGMQGLANSFQFLPANQGHATKMMNWISELVMKIIE